VRQALFLLLATLVLAAGCGSDVGKRLTKDEYASRADAICGKYNREVGKLATPETFSEVADVADRTLTVLGKAIADLKKLNPPVIEQAKVDQWLSQVENLEEDLKEIRDAAEAKDRQAMQAVVPKAEEHNRRSNALATELGLTVCNSD
jgi:hypothetical protein